MSTESRRYTLSPLAEADLEEIWVFTLSRWSLEQANSYIQEITSALGQLSKGLKIGQKIDIREGYFRYFVRSHTIYYRVNGSALEVIRILHQRMDVDRYL